MRKMTIGIVATYLLLIGIMASAAAQLNYVSSSDGLYNCPRLGSGRTDLAFADINNDGNADLLSVGDHDSPWLGSEQRGVMVWFGDGAGNWSVYLPLFPEDKFGYGGVAVADVNWDGHWDVGYGIHHNYANPGNDLGDQILEVALGDGTGRHWTPWDDSLAQGVPGLDYGMFTTDFGDVDNDGNLDVGSISFGADDGIHVYRNLRNGVWRRTFGFVGGNSRMEFFFRDVNRDGNVDILAAHGTGTVWFGDGRGGFTPQNTGLPSSSIGLIGVSAGDVDNDGGCDLAFCNTSYGVEVWRWDGAGMRWTNFSGSLPATGTYQCTRLCDMNADGFMDVVAIGSGPLKVWTGDGAGNWTEAASITVPTGYRAFRTGWDFDHNGRPDIAFVAGQAYAYKEVSSAEVLSVFPVFPRGGEKFRGGSVQFVDWWSATSNAPDTRVKLELSTQGQSGPWVQIVDSLRNAGRFQWQLPAELSSSNCYIRYTVYGPEGSVTATTPRAFEIAAPMAPEQFPLVSPANGTINRPIAGTLRWEAAARATGYDVYLDVVSPPVNRVSENQPGLTYDYTGLANDQTYYWQIVARNIGGSVSSVEWNFKTVVAAPEPPALISPENGAIDQPKAGTLVWGEAARATGYDVWLSVDNPPESKVSSNQASTTYDYSRLLNGVTYYWKIVARNVGGGASSTVWNFTTVMAAPTVVVTSPNGGEVWGVGSAWTINCTHGGGTAVTDSVLLSTDGGMTWLFQFKAAASNSHPWTVPDCPTTQARIKMVAINAAGMAGDESNTDFTILALPTVAVVSPNGGEVWGIGTSRAITCTHGGGTVVTDSVLLSTDGGMTWLFQFKAAASSSHLWTVADYPTTQARIKVVAVNAGGTGEDVSNADFTILALPTVAVVSPNGGEAWGVGTSRAITCTHGGGTVVTDSVLLSTDGGSTWLFQFKAAASNSHPWTVPDNPTAQARVKVVAVGAGGTGEDVSDADFTIQYGFSADVGAVSIAVPQGRYPPDMTITPQATWRNCGNVAADFEAWMILAGPSGVREYGQKVDVSGLAVGSDTIVNTFPPHTLATLGDWTVRCSTYYADDEYPGNDVIDGCFLVLPPWFERWHEAKPLAHTSGDKPVKDGGWLALHQAGADGDPVLYVAKGNKTIDFFRYYPVEDSWLSRKAIPDMEGTKTKPPSKGCVGVSDGGNFVYMTKGNNTLGFWRYDITANNWGTPLAGVPEGPNRKRVKGGTDMVYVPGRGDTGYIYLLKGYKTEFYRYNTKTGTWDLPLPDAPAGGGKAKYDKGSFLVYDQAGHIYAHQAKYYDKTAGYHYMFRYDLQTGRWTDTLKGMPLAGIHGGRPGKNKKSKDGGSGAWYGENIYALKGGNTQQFFRYFPDDNTWQELDTVPGNGSTGKKKYVKQGADLVSFGSGAFFALKGNKTFEMWRYVTPADGLQLTANGRSGVMAGNVEVRTSKCELLPNPIASGFATLRFGLPKAGPVTVTVFDVAGRSVFATRSLGHLTTGSLPLDLRKLSSGVYLVRLGADGYTASQKLVVRH